MPLPAGGDVQWPPKGLDDVTARLAVWSAWYSGDPDELSSLYGGTLAGDPGVPGTRWITPDQSGWRGWLGRTLARFFWGTQTPASERRTKLHLPVAGDIAATSAALLFSEPPTITVDHTATQARLDELVDDGMHADLLEAAEVCAALGGVYLRTMWDTDIRDRAWLTAVHADAAIPEWKHGVLRAVTFWRVVDVDGSTVWRHLERHEPGVILHGLYRGGPASLGAPVDLREQPATEDLEPRVETGLPDGMMTVSYIPNIRPARVWRNVPAGAYLGRSDFAGTEGLMDALDETYTSLMRDVRLGKARLHVPATYLQSHSPGQGASFEDREVYAPVNTLGGSLDAGLQIEQSQFEIRVEEHLRTALELYTRILSTAGYSAQTFGLEGQVAVTATEVVARERRSYVTRDHKIRYWRPGLSEQLEVLLAVEKKVFGRNVEIGRPRLDFGDGVSEDPRTVAETLELLGRAQAASIETRVRMLHPDWDDPEIAAEVKLIKADSSLGTVENPETFTGLPAAEKATEEPPEELAANDAKE